MTREKDLELRKAIESAKKNVEQLQKRAIAGSYIRQMRNKRGYTLADMAERLDKSALFISEMERGQKRMPDEFIRNVSKILHIDENIIFGILDRPFLAARETLEENQYVQELLSNPQLQKLLSKLGKNPKLNEEQKEKLTKNMIEMYAEFVREIEGDES